MTGSRGGVVRRADGMAPTPEVNAAIETILDKFWSPPAEPAGLHAGPAFRTLRGDPRCERIRSRIAAHVARKRSEAETVRI